MRDSADNVVIVCSIENVDPMGVHTGDSVTVAPQQTLTDRLYQRLRDQAIAVIRAVGVETGGSNVQFAVNPAHRGDPRDRDEPARVALLGAGLQGDGLPDREDRRAPGRRLPPRRDRQRHHRRHPGVLRADDRLRRRQVAALRVREVPRHRRDAHHAHEVRRRGDGDRAHVRAGVRQGAALARAGQAARAWTTSPSRSCSTGLRHPGGRIATRRSSSCCAAADVESDRTSARDRPVVPARAARARADPDAPFAGERSFRSVDTCAAEFPARTPYYYSGWERHSGGRPARGRAAASASRS